MDKTTPIEVRFSRGGSPRESVKITRLRTYRVTVNNGPWETFRLPWNQNQLDAHIRVLRNTELGEAPRIAKLEQMGRALGKALGKVKSFTQALDERADDMRCIIWILGWPELAKIPWELATRWISPYKHILLEEGMTFVRRVPIPSSRSRTIWPTGQKRRLRLLFIWSETTNGKVPHKEHLAALDKSCTDNGVELIAQEIRNIDELQGLCEDTPFDFIHVLAHGARTEDEQWGLSLTDEVIKGEQLARALMSGDSTPALVTLAACDSGAELGADEESSYGSVAYELHVKGIPMVRASLFRLRKEISVYSVERVYKALLTGDHPLRILSSMRRKLSPRDNESWANEVIYLGDITDTLDEIAAVGRQQGVLRRAQVIADRYNGNRPDNPAECQLAIEELDAEISRLRPLIEEEFDLPETFGLLGSLTRRIAYFRNETPDSEELRNARKFYEKGLRACPIAHYPGIDAIHLCRLVGGDDSKELADELLPVVRFALDNEKNKHNPDHWAFASAGELEVYAGNADKAVDLYREFLHRQPEVIRDRSKQCDEIETAHRQLDKFLEQFSSQGDDKSKKIIDAAKKSLSVLHGELSRAKEELKFGKEKVDDVAGAETPLSAPPQVKMSASMPVRAGIKPSAVDKSKSDKEIYNVHMLPASLGDALWIEYGDPLKPHRVLIDGGKVDTADVIKSRILDVVKREGVCRLELLVVSHIDADHIEGIIKLLGDSTLKNKLIIDDIWFNGEHHLPHPDSENEDNPDFLSARQGEFLSVLIERRGLKWNHQPWGGKTIFVPKTERLPRHTLKGGLEIVLLSPTYDALRRLSRKWKDELDNSGLAEMNDEQILEELGHDRKLAPDDEFLDVGPDAVRALVSAKAKKDTSEANGSSIAFIATFNDHHCLFAGDAYSDVLQDGVERLLKERKQGEKALKLGAFKVPHHGSRANLHEGLLKRLDCQHFLVSTNGSQFHHPDKQAIAHIIDGAWRPNKEKSVELHFNYHTEYNEPWDESILMKKFNYQVDFPESDGAGLTFPVP